MEVEPSLAYTIRLCLKKQKQKQKKNKTKEKPGEMKTQENENKIKSLNLLSIWRLENPALAQLE